MKESDKDQKWQDRLDEGKLTAGNKVDRGGQAYQFLYKALQQEPDVVIPADFAERVAQQAVSQSKSKSNWYWLLAIVLAGLATFICGTVLFFSSPNYFQLLQSNLNILGFAGLAFIAVQVADYYLVQRKQTI